MLEYKIHNTYVHLALVSEHNKTLVWRSTALVSPGGPGPGRHTTASHTPHRARWATVAHTGVLRCGGHRPMNKCTGAHTQAPRPPEGAWLQLSATQMPTSVCGTNMSQPPQPWAAWLRLTSQNKSSLTRQAKTHESSEGQGREWRGVGGEVVRNSSRGSISPCPTNTSRNNSI